MPYIWVDDIECCGDCAHSERLMEGIKTAFNLIKAGNVSAAANALGVLSGDTDARRAAEHEKELSILFAKWRDAGRPGGFLDWAHDKRKASLT